MGRVKRVLPRKNRGRTPKCTLAPWDISFGGDERSVREEGRRKLKEAGKGRFLLRADRIVYFDSPELQK